MSEQIKCKAFVIAFDEMRKENFGSVIKSIVKIKQNFCVTDKIKNLMQQQQTSFRPEWYFESGQKKLT